MPFIRVTFPLENPLSKIFEGVVFNVTNSGIIHSQGLESYTFVTEKPLSEVSTMLTEAFQGNRVVEQPQPFEDQFGNKGVEFCVFMK